MRCRYRWQCSDNIMGGDQVPLDEDGIIVCPFCEPWRMARVPWSPLPGEGLFRNVVMFSTLLDGHRE